MADNDARFFEVAQVNVRYPASHDANLMYRDPKDAAQAKFSLEYALAVILLEGNCTLGNFAREGWMHPEPRALYPCIRRCPVDRPEGEFPTEIEVVLTDGRRFETSLRMPMGSIEAPFTPGQLWAKFDGCLAGVLPPQATLALRRALEDLDHLADIGQLTMPLRGPFALPLEDHR